MIVCPFAPKFHCRPTCVFRIEKGNKVECLIREALFHYLGYDTTFKGADIEFTPIHKEEET